jgi:hypothetical protein
MSDLDAVLERLVTDPAFVQELSHNPTTALAGYELSEEDLSTLSTQVSFDRGAVALVEERVSKSSMFGLLSTMAGGLSGLGGDTAGLGGPDTSPADVGVENPTTIGDPNLAPGDDLEQGFAVDAFHDSEEGPEELGGIGDPNVIDPNQTPGDEHGAVDAFMPSDVEEGPEESTGIGDPSQSPGDEHGAVDAFMPSDVEEGPEESVGFHEVEEQPAPDLAIHEVDQPAATPGLVNSGDRVGFNPQPDPPGLPG